MHVTVVGSVNLDLVARVSALPAPGETVSGSDLERIPGGKGANQALAARRLGADVSLIAAVGDDALADEALALLEADGVDLSGVRRVAGVPTGTALITVDASGETTIVVSPGANASLRVEDVPVSDLLLVQLEVPLPVVSAALTAASWSCLNVAPPVGLPDGVPSLVVANSAELAALPDIAAVPLLAVTHGARGAELRRQGVVVASAEPPPVVAVDGTGAGDAFTAALALGLWEGRSDLEALERACRVGALTASRAGAQPSLPWASEV